MNNFTVRIKCKGFPTVKNSTRVNYGYLNTRFLEITRFFKNRFVNLTLLFSSHLNHKKNIRK